MSVHEIFVWLVNTGWPLQVFFVVFISLILHWLVTHIYKKIFPKLQQTGPIWDDALVFALYKPLALFVWIVGISFAADIVAVHAAQKAIFAIVEPTRNTGILVTAVWCLIRFVSYFEDHFIIKKIAAEKEFDKTGVHALCQILRAAVIITGVLIGMQMFGIRISAVLAFGGISGLAVGFAAKDLLANFFGGLMIYLDRPFSVGDWIRSSEREIEGTVEHIGWRLTRILTFDKRPLFVPNGLFSTITVENPSRMTNRRIKAVINLRYDDAAKVVAVLQDIEQMLRSHPDIDTKQTLMVNLIECAPYSLNFMIYTFTKTVKWAEFQAVQQDVLVKVLEIVSKHKAECAFPTSTIHIPNEIDFHLTKETNL